MKRRICVITGSRADYGHLVWLLREIRNDPELDLALIATGSHFAEEFGKTITVIERDGLPIASRVVPSRIGSDRLSACRVMGEIVAGVAEALDRLRPDVLVVLGDRYEMLAAAEAALILGIPIAHLHGGEISAGAFDDSIRNAITKLAHLHFAAAGMYRDRIVQMGESPERVFDVGAPGLDWLDRLPLLDRATLELQLGFSLSDPIFLVTFHPVTLRECGSDCFAAEEIVAALSAFPQASILITGVNADPGYAEIRPVFEAFAEWRPSHVHIITSLGQPHYLSLLKIASAVIGNSSSGIIEAPAVGAPSVNIGSRQEGRARTPSVLDCAERREDILRAIQTALSDDFRVKAASQSTIYGSRDASRKIKEILKTIPINGLMRKTAPVSWCGPR